MTNYNIPPYHKISNVRFLIISNLIYIVFSLLYLTPPTFGQTEYPFETARPHYVGARALAMGNAFTAVADDATSGFWNPAGMIQWDGVKLFGVMKLHDRHFYRFDPKGIGFSWRGNSLYWGNKIAIDVPSGVPDYNYYSIARKLGPYFAAGGSLKFKRRHPSDYYQFFGYHTSYDLGFLFKPRPELKFGCLLQNLEGSRIQWVTIGSVYLYSSYLFSADIAISTEEAETEYYLGAEWYPYSYFSIRVGSSNGAITGGLGLRIIDVYLHYARIYEPHFVSHYISAELHF
ncbi:hypothetical protein C6497_06880 [Candidatus Poribacteria bacterium]|nr:MAG: hypothetical protein C6497_06880 [Candidatus Poribacteria bacterium]